MHPVARAWKRDRVRRIRAIKRGMATMSKQARAAITAAAKRGGVTRSTPLVERFWSKVKKTKTCWLWTGCTFKKLSCNSYGYIGRGGKYGATVLAHRLSYELHYGPPGKMQVQHKCDNPLCVRPSHLKLGTAQDNSNDMKRRNRKRGRPSKG